MLDKQGHTRARAHTHSQISNTYCFSTAKAFRERASVLLHTYIDCLVYESRKFVTVFTTADTGM